MVFNANAVFCIKGRVAGIRHWHDGIAVVMVSYLDLLMASQWFETIHTGHPLKYHGTVPYHDCNLCPKSIVMIFLIIPWSDKGAARVATLVL